MTSCSVLKSSSSLLAISNILFLMPWGDHSFSSIPKTRHIDTVPVATVWRILLERYAKTEWVSMRRSNIRAWKRSVASRDWLILLEARCWLVGCYHQWQTNDLWAVNGKSVASASPSLCHASLTWRQPSATIPVSRKCDLWYTWAVR